MLAGRLLIAGAVSLWCCWWGPAPPQHRPGWDRPFSLDEARAFYGLEQQATYRLTTAGAADQVSLGEVRWVGSSGGLIRWLRFDPAGHLVVPPEWEHKSWSWLTRVWRYPGEDTRVDDGVALQVGAGEFWCRHFDWRSQAPNDRRHIAQWWSRALPGWVVRDVRDGDAPRRVTTLQDYVEGAERNAPELVPVEDAVLAQTGSRRLRYRVTRNGIVTIWQREIYVGRNWVSLQDWIGEQAVPNYQTRRTWRGSIGDYTRRFTLPELWTTQKQPTVVLPIGRLMPIEYTVRAPDGSRREIAFHGDHPGYPVYETRESPSGKTVWYMELLSVTGPK